MIVACPACATRYDFPAERFSTSGTMVRCVQCGRSWIESGPVEIIDLAPRALPGRAALPFPATIPSPHDEDDREIRRLTEAARLARQAFHAMQQRRRRRLAGAAALTAALMAPFAAALLHPELTVRLLPASMQLFDRLGMQVNIYGLQVRRIEQRHMIVEGTRVIAIKGEIVNVSNHDRKVPSLRFALRDGDSDEVYAWTVDSTVRPLRPGEMITFTTRVASPPPRAENVQIRFAHADEIGVNPRHESH